MIDFIKSYIGALQGTLSRFPVEGIAETIRQILDARERDAQIFIVGNGGSATTAAHMSVDLGKGASYGRDKRFRVIALTTNVPWMTAIANDITYDDVFVEQLRNFARPGDLVLAFSGSGNSENVLRAVRYANQAGCATVGISGYEGGKLGREAQRCIVVPSDDMGRIEDGQMIVQHIITYYLMSLPAAPHA